MEADPGYSPPDVAGDQVGRDGQSLSALAGRVNSRVVCGPAVSAPRALPALACDLHDHAGPAASLGLDGEVQALAAGSDDPAGAGGAGAASLGLDGEVQAVAAGSDDPAGAGGAGGMM